MYTLKKNPPHTRVWKIILQIKSQVNPIKSKALETLRVNLVLSNRDVKKRVGRRIHLLFRLDLSKSIPKTKLHSPPKRQQEVGAKIQLKLESEDDYDELRWKGTHNRGKICIADQGDITTSKKHDLATPSPITSKQLSTLRSLRSPRPQKCHKFNHCNTTKLMRRRISLQEMGDNYY